MSVKKQNLLKLENRKNLKYRQRFEKEQLEFLQGQPGYQPFMYPSSLPLHDAKAFTEDPNRDTISGEKPVLNNFMNLNSIQTNDPMFFHQDPVTFYMPQSHQYT